MKRILILLSFLAISCQSNSGEMPRQTGQASSELMNGLEAMHHVRFAEARALFLEGIENCLLYTSPSPRDDQTSRMPSSA